MQVYLHGHTHKHKQPLANTTLIDKRMKRQQVDLSSRSALSLLGWKPNTPLKAAVEYFNIDWEFSEPAEMCSLDYATGTVDSVTGTYPYGNEFVVDER